MRTLWPLVLALVFVFAFVLTGCGTPAARRTDGHLEGPEQDTLSTPVALEVYTDTGGYRSLGKTLDGPVKVPHGANWWVEPLLKSEGEVAQLADEVERLGIPELRFYNRVGVGFELSDAALAQLAGLTTLTGLKLQSKRLTDAGLAPLASLTGLKSLYIHMVPVGDPALAYLAALPHLEELSVPDGVTAAGLAYLQNVKSLKRLYLTYTAGDRELEALSPFPALECVIASGGAVTDKGVLALARHKTLTRLDLKGTSVTDAGVEVLSGLPHLNWLSLRGCERVTPAARDLLAKTLPGLHLE